MPRLDDRKTAERLGKQSYQIMKQRAGDAICIGRFSQFARVSVEQE